MGTKDFPRRQLCARDVGRTGRARRGNSGALLQSRRLHRRDHRLCDGAVAGRWRAGRVLDECRHEEKPPRHFAHVHVPSARSRKMVELLFKHTTTLGVRESVFRRYTLSRESKTIQTPDGDIRVKVSSGYGVAREKPEFDDLAKIARRPERAFLSFKKHLNHKSAAAHRQNVNRGVSFQMQNPRDPSLDCAGDFMPSRDTYYRRISGSA